MIQVALNVLISADTTCPVPCARPRAGVGRRLVVIL